MPVTKGAYADNESRVYQFLINSGLNTAAACGILANLAEEGSFNPKNLQNAYESSLGYNDSTYTSAVDSGRYKNFSGDSAGYGLAQWTYRTRKAELLSYAKTRNTSIGDINTQLQFLLRELQKSYATLWSLLKSVSNSSDGAYTAGKRFCSDFERPAGGETTAARRGATARDSYWSFYSNPNNTKNIKSVENIGAKIVAIAKEQVGKSYEAGKNGVNSFDSSGLVQYCYNQAGYAMIDRTVTGHYNAYKDTATHVSSSSIAAGDLLFYKESRRGSNDLVYMAIADGEGGRIYARNTISKVTHDNTSIGNPDYILRILSSAQTAVLGESIAIGGDAVGSVVLSSTDEHAKSIAQNLSRVSATGFDYGYLIDLNHGGEFKFYIPEFSESAGAQWSPIEIRGRSVTVQSYESTSSRTINISLDLYAGAGLYTKSSGDVVGDLHKDANFVKSLEYPDYTTAITEPPPTVQLILGAAISLVGVISGVTVEHLKPLDEYNRSMYIRLSFTFTQISKNPPDYRDIRAGQYTLSSTEDIGSLLDVSSTYTRGPAARNQLLDTINTMK